MHGKILYLRQYEKVKSDHNYIYSQKHTTILSNGSLQKSDYTIIEYYTASVILLTPYQQQWHFYLFTYDSYYQICLMSLILFPITNKKRKDS